jgi:uncharacterized protein
MKLNYFKLLCIFALSFDVNAASYDCTGKLNLTEQAICSSKALNLLDEQLSQYYSEQLTALQNADKSDLISKQRKWIRKRNHNCEANVDCLAVLYTSRIQQLSHRPEIIEATNATFSHQPKVDSFKVDKKCEFSNIKFSENIEVYAGGAYSGYKTNYQIDESGHMNTVFDVAVNSPHVPVVLILGAYEPSIWNIKWTQDTQIEAVYAMGYYRQIVTGLASDTPVIMSSSRERPNCRDSFDISVKTLDKINPLSIHLFNKKVSLVTFAKSGKLGFGDSFDQKTEFFTNAASTLDSHVEQSLPLAGKAGLDELSARGDIRRYNNKDIEKWIKLKSDQLNEDLPPVSGMDISSRYKPKHVSKGYVILNKITIPAGLYGGNRVTFFLNENAPFPEGDLGHSDLYDFNTLKCHGSLCNM